jgi:hypothetical protein
MNRRRFIVGVGATAAGASGLVGTGAVSSVTADRAVEVTVAPDFETANSDGAYLEMSDTSEVAIPNLSNGTLTLDFTQLNDSAIGTGFNPNSVYELRGGDSGIFQLRNQSQNDVEIAAVTADSPDEIPELKDSRTLPSKNRTDADGPRIEIFHVDDPDRTALTDTNRYELSVGEQVALGTRVIVPRIPPGTYNQVLLLQARSVSG